MVQPVDDLHNIPIDFKVTNENDSKAIWRCRGKTIWDTMILLQYMKG
jgi:hypothetical protein